MGNWCMLEMKRFLGNRLVGVRTNPSVALVVGGRLSQQTGGGGVLFFVCLLGFLVFFFSLNFS